MGKKEDEAKEIERLKLLVEMLSPDCMFVDTYGMDLDHSRDLLDWLKDCNEYPADVDEYFNSDLSLNIIPNGTKWDVVEKWYEADKEYYQYLRYTLGFWGDTTPSWQEYEDKYADKEKNAKAQKRIDEIREKAKNL